MLGRLRRGATCSSPSHGTSYYGAEKLALFGATHRVLPDEILSSPCPNPTCRQHFCRPEGAASIACFNLAISRSGGLRCPASHANMRKRSRSCETCPNDSSRPPLRRSRHKQTVARWMGVIGDAPTGTGERDACADRSWLACRSKRCRPAAALQETLRSTRRARDHRNSPRVRQGHHLDPT
jgi:hypothetical protein